ncbi:MAG: NAD(P)H-binding protein [Pseudonocardiaceae bacterium]
MTILVTGSRGHVGRSVLSQLLAAGQPVRALRHHQEPNDPSSSVEIMEGDLARPQTLRLALEGVRKVFLYGNAQAIDEFIAEATKAGVTHVVALSSASVAASNADVNPIARRHLAIERALADSELGTTFLRPAAFATNTLRWTPSIRAESVVRAPYPNSYVAPIHEADIAAVAVRGLTGEGHEGASYFLTGPEALSQRQQVRLIAGVLGRPLRFEEQTPGEAREEMIKTVPGEIVDTVLGYLAASDGAPRMITDTVAHITGRPALTFAQWVGDHLVDFQ